MTPAAIPDDLLRMLSRYPDWMETEPYVVSFDLASDYGASAREAHERVRQLLGHGDFTLADATGEEWTFSPGTVAAFVTWQSGQGNPL